MLLEREGELEALGAALIGARAGRGVGVLVEGPAGIGKTGLLEAVRERASDELVLGARGSRIERDYPFGVARQMLAPALTAATSRRRATLIRAGRGAGALFSPRGSGRLPRDAYSVLHGLYGVIAALSESGPVLLIVDDLHWADLESQRFVAFLGRRVETLPVALVAASRPAGEWETRGVYDALADDPGVRIIKPRPLSAIATGRLADEAFGQPAEAGFTAACQRVSGGNPFFVHEILRELGGRGVEPLDEQASELDGLGPHEVSRSLFARLGALGADATSLAVAVAVLGDHVAPRLGGSLASLKPETARAAADALRAAAILSGSEAELAFAHPVLCASVLDGLAAAERTDSHIRAADLLRQDGGAPAAVAGHLLAAAPGACEWATEALATAAGDAAASGAPGSAEVYLRRALEEWPEPPARGHLVLELGRAQALQRDPGAAQTLQRVIAEAPSADDRMSAALLLWTVDSYDGLVSEGLPVLRRALESGDGSNAALVQSLELEMARGTRSMRTTAAEGRRRIAALRNRTWEDPDLERLALGLVAYDALLANDPVGKVIALLDRALPLEDAILERGDSQLLHVPVYTLIYSDRLVDARAMLDRLMARARERGSAIGVLIAAVWRGLASLRAGALRDAEADARLALDGARELRWRFGAAAGRQWLAEIHIERGEIDAAGKLWGTSPPRLEGGVESKGWSHHIRHGRARYLMARGDADDALDEFLAVGKLHDEFIARSPAELPWRSDAALAALAVGRSEQAAALAAEELALARDGGIPRALGISLRVHGVVLRETASLDEAVTVLADSPARLEHARALAELGALLHERGLVADARDALRDALEVAVECGGTSVAARARGLLIATGARPRRSVTTGVGALSTAEFRVARLAADGATNPEIASELYLSRKTVEGHLSSAYRKLGTHTRGQLARKLGEGSVQDLRPRRPDREKTALTPGEERVAALAADGLSNPQIADALSISRKTVEAHLRAAFRKLDVAARAELGAALGREASLS